MIIKTGPKRCTLCFRNEQEAIREQVSKGRGCGNPKCVFADSIKRAIENAKNSRYCINCGYEFQQGDKFCIICGIKRDI